MKNLTMNTVAINPMAAAVEGTAPFGTVTENGEIVFTELEGIILQFLFGFDVIEAAPVPAADTDGDEIRL